MEKAVAVKTMTMGVPEIGSLAQALAKSKLWPGFQSADQIVGLMLLCQSEGLHPMDAVRQYDIIQGRPAMKSEAQLAKFYARGGKVKWIKRDATECRAVFTHPANCPEGVEVSWTMKEAQAAGLAGKDNWKKFPRQMLSARVQAEGVQIADPGAALGINNTEEQMDVAALQADEVSALAASLTGADPAPADTTVTEPEGKEDKEWRKLRAALNKTLQPIKTIADFRAACMDFQTKNGGKAIWMQRTCHKHQAWNGSAWVDETFGMVAEVHKSRVEADITAPDRFITYIGRANGVAGLADCVNSYRTNAAFQGDHDIEQALHDKALSLGLESYGQVDEMEDPDENEVYAEAGTPDAGKPE